MTNRREFLQQSTTFALTGLLLPRMNNIVSFFERKTKWPVGLQLYTLGNLMTTDPKGTLQKLATIGYKSWKVQDHKREIFMDIHRKNLLPW